MNPDKSQLVRIVLDTGEDLGSRVLALVDEEHAKYLAEYYEKRFMFDVLKQETKAAEANRVEEHRRLRELRQDLETGRVLVLYRTFGRPQ